VHSTHFVASFLAANEDLGVRLEWHPSDPDAEARASIDARVRQARLEGPIAEANGWVLGITGGTACGDGDRTKILDMDDTGAIRGEREGDVAEYERYRRYFDLVTCINMIHIAPWEATLGLMECAEKVLRKGGRLMCYGPYKIGGTAVESNLNFDNSLRSKNTEWGLRNLEDVIEAAKNAGLAFERKIEMPANNLSILFCKT